MPEITPAGLIFNPGGKGELPASRLKVTGIFPPVACSAALYTFPAVPEGSDVVVKVRDGHAGCCPAPGCITGIGDCVVLVCAFITISVVAGSGLLGLVEQECALDRTVILYFPADL
jgi:hypothetical protein